jgi:hypothetical protein
MRSLFVLKDNGYPQYIQINGNLVFESGFAVCNRDLALKPRLQTAKPTYFTPKLSAFEKNKYFYSLKKIGIIKNYKRYG